MIRFIIELVINKMINIIVIKVKATSFNELNKGRQIRLKHVELSYANDQSVDK